MNIEVNPIGFFHCQQKERYQLARQGGVLDNIHGEIHLLPHKNYEQALQDLDGFEHIWIVYYFHRNKLWKPKVMPPRGDRKVGVFATRSPHRPNFIGLSRVKLVDVNGLKLTIEDHDLIDETPILDIKPYINYCDEKHSSRQGWLDELENSKHSYHIEWSKLSKDQNKFLIQHSIDVQAAILPRLSLYPFPRKSNRIRQINENEYEVAYKSWRIIYSVDESHYIVSIKEIKSGYSNNYLKTDSEDKWGDIAIHKEYIATYQ